MAPPDRAASANTDIGVDKSLLIATPEKCGGIALLILLCGARSLLCVPAGIAAAIAWARRGKRRIVAAGVFVRLLSMILLLSPDRMCSHFVPGI
jgi:hypothetical protein